jgi:plastocyanin
MPHRPTLRSMQVAAALVLTLGSAAAASQPETPVASDEPGRWPTAAEARTALVELGYEFQANGQSSPWSGTGFWSGARPTAADSPSASGERWLRVDHPDESAARIWLLLANDDRATQLLDVGSVLGIPRPALDEASALVQISPEWTDGPDCAFFEWHVSGGRMVLWRDSLSGDQDFEIAFEPPPTAESPGTDAGEVDAIPRSASEACGATLTIEAADLWFRPAEVTLASSGSSTIRLENNGRVVHNLTVDELGLQIVVTARSSGEAVLVDPSPGTYEFYCSVSGHREAGMVGTLTVE